MVVGVLEVELVRLVVAVLRGQFRLNLVEVQRLELQPHHRPRGVLREDLVDLDPDLLAGCQLSLDEVIVENLLRNRLSHIVRVSSLGGYKSGEFPPRRS
ncbi:hypothetical protein GCM10009000_020770 [Halobacterium noricense]